MSRKMKIPLITPAIVFLLCGCVTQPVAPTGPVDSLVGRIVEVDTSLSWAGPGPIGRFLGKTFDVTFQIVDPKGCHDTPVTISECPPNESLFATNRLIVVRGRLLESPSGPRSPVLILRLPPGSKSHSYGMRYHNVLVLPHRDGDEN